MPSRDTRIVLNADLISKSTTPIHSEVRNLFPGIVIVERQGDGSSAWVLDVQPIVIDSTSESCFESRGKAVAMDYEAALNARLERPGQEEA